MIMKKSRDKISELKEPLKGALPKKEVGASEPSIVAKFKKKMHDLFKPAAVAAVADPRSTERNTMHDITNLPCHPLIDEKKQMDYMIKKGIRLITKGIPPDAVNAKLIHDCLERERRIDNFLQGKENNFSGLGLTTDEIAHIQAAAHKSEEYPPLTPGGPRASK